MQQTLDISNWNGAITVALVQCWAQHGPRRIHVQAVNPPAPYPPTQTREQLQACKDAGMPTDGYVWYWPGTDPALAAASCKLFEGFEIGHRFLDCETTPPAGMTAGQIRQEIRKYIAACGIDGIYTRRQWWVDYTGDWDIVAEYPDILLWDAYWTDRRADFTYWDNPANHYGGWAAPALKQYGSGSLCGVDGLDMNVINEEVFVPPAPYVGDDYWAKFGPDGNGSLANRYDWPGVAANLEGVIHEVQTQAGTDAACEDKLSRIQQVLSGGTTP